MEFESCSICTYSYSEQAGNKRSTEKCTMPCETECSSKCVGDSDVCSLHLKQRYPITCPSCGKDACRICYMRFFLSDTEEETRCIHCEKMFDDEFLLGKDHLNNQRFSKAFVWGLLKEHREHVLLDQIIARLPSFQHIATAETRIERYNEKLKKIKKRIAILDLERNKIQHKLSNERFLIANGRYPANTPDFQEEVPEEKNFASRGKCPVDGCNGFIEDKWKCGICNSKVCSHCMMTSDEDHECKEEDVESTKMIRDSTKPCPSCRTRIQRIEGCFARDTPILLYDTTTKMVQDVIVGDILIGDDGEKRVVQSVVSGKDSMYKVNQNNGESYVVNSLHTLVLCNENNEIIQITVKDYIALSNYKKSLLYGIKSDAGVNYEKQHVEIEPYILGLWLGDGTHTHPVIASNDIEIQTYLLDWCSNNDAELMHEEGVKFTIRRKGNSNGKDVIKKPIGYTSCDDCKGCKTMKQEICNTVMEGDFIQKVKRQTNPFLEQLRLYNLIGNKHIPVEYLMNSREVRLAVLAGLIDTDGNVSNEGKRVVIIQTNPVLSEQIIFLARSLGFVVSITMRTRKNVSIFGLEKKDYKDQYVITISGKDLSIIPTLIPRKKCVNSKSNKNQFKNSISVEYIGEDMYYGFQVDKNNLFIAKDTTIYKNCNQMWCTACHVFFNWATGEQLNKTQWVHNPHHQEWLRTNGVAQVIEGGGCGVNAQTIQHLKLTPANENIMLSWLRKANHMLDFLAQYRDPLEQRVRKTSVNYLRGFIHKEDLKILIQRHYKASKKEKLTNLRRDMYAHTLQDIVQMTYTDILNAGIIPSNRELAFNKGVALVKSLTSYTEECMRSIGNIFNSSTPTISEGFVNYA